ncbi:hypothetical protein [Plantactinospora sp. KBS50]|uniref:hypothetical protein n=1 Tax=Plantactinospora sp. KBS50 TaxID=2024580 RepID=UPI0012FE4B0A|nr:hypothetical protein [Plantactinospora sp. KBS50]
MTGMPQPAVRAGAVARMIWGAALLAVPGTVLRGLGGRRSELAVATLRVLGTRQLAQGAVTVVRPSAGVLVAGAVTDVLHGASAVLLAGLDRRQRRPAVTEAALAAGWFAITVAARSRPGGR